MKDFIDKNFEEVSLAIVESIRLGNGLNEDLFQRLKKAIDNLKCKYAGLESMPKYTYYCIQTLRDNIIGTLNSRDKKEHEILTKYSSFIDQNIEELLLSD
jgi:hypothetical protein